MRHYNTIWDRVCKGLHLYCYGLCWFILFLWWFNIQLNNYKLNELAYVYFESNLNKKVFILNCFKDIIKKEIII
jgi:hypothetical protein